MINMQVTFNAEVRGKEKKVSKNGSTYGIVRAEDERGVLNEICERDMERFDYYAKGQQVAFTLHIESGKYTNISIVDADIKSDK